MRTSEQKEPQVRPAFCAVQDNRAVGLCAGTVMGRGGEGRWRASRSKGWGRFAQAAEVMVWRLGEMAETWARDPPEMGRELSQ